MFLVDRTFDSGIGTVDPPLGIDGRCLAEVIIHRIQD